MAEIQTPEDIIAEISRYYAKRKKTKGTVADKVYEIGYDSPSSTLEPIYFWILDFMTNFFEEQDIKKFVDNFTSSPGSGHFSELMSKGTRMQEEGMKIMQTIGVLIKSLINIIYDLRQFEIRLNDYKEANSENKDKSEAGLLALKQTWLDNVDMKRGNTSIKAMAFSNAAFATLIDGFMVAKTVADVKKMDLNERVKRILEQRILEFNKWRELSEKELRKRYNVEKVWLKNQVNSLKLYSRWAKPYLKAAEELSMHETKDAALVKAFNTIIMELVILGKTPIDVREQAQNFKLPEDFKNIKFKRKYYSCVLVEFKFRGIPQKAGQHYVFGGKADVALKSFALNDDELKLLEKEVDKSDMGDAFSLVEGATSETLDEIREDIEYFLKDEEQREIEEYEKTASQDVNPFAALIGLGLKKPKSVAKKEKAGKKEIKDISDIKPDNYAESVVRKFAAEEAADTCYDIYNIYKKAHGMVSTYEPV